MLIPVPTSSQRYKCDKRLLATLAVTEAETHVLKKVFSKKTPGLPPRTAAVQLSNPEFFTREAMTKFTDSKNQPYVRNITFTDADTGAVILQCFGPSSQSTSNDMKASAVHGMDLFKVVTKMAKCKKHKADTQQSKEQQTFPHYHFGAWYDCFKTNLVLTGETLQAGNKEGKQAVVDFCAWFKGFAKSCIQLLVDNKDSGLCDAFRAELIAQRDNHFPWACKQVKGLDTICHWLYATISPFQGFSNNSHIDDEEADASILVNLGQHALLELHHYNVQLVLQPLDVVVFLSNSVYHHTLQHAAHVIDPKSQVGDCMAITCFFCQALVDHY
ncbi:hypothetical protein NDA16_004184 [Ustilago loliicola]|nr:hypothetical protein NDA16_004184 [Ustilago loliicola]